MKRVKLLLHIFQNGNMIKVPKRYGREAYTMQSILLMLRKEQKKATQQEVANYLGISVATYRAKELGRREFTQDEMFALSKYFERPIDQIFLPRNYQNGTKRISKTITWEEKFYGKNR